MQLEVNGLVTMHSSSLGAVTLTDGRLVEHFHHPSTGSQFRVDGGPLINHGLSDVTCPRLHPDYGIIVCTGNRLVAIDPESPGSGNVIHTFSGFSKVTIGEGEGSIVYERYIPIVLDNSALGVYDLEADTFWTQSGIGAVDTGHVVAGPDGYAVARTDGNGTWRISSAGDNHKWLNGGGHATVVEVGNEVWYVFTSSDLGSADLNNWGIPGSGSQQYAVAIDIVSQEVRWLHNTGWVAQHFAGLGSALAMSYELAGGGAPDVEIEVWDLAVPEIILPKFSTGFHPPNWSDYFDQAKPMLGTNNKVYFTAGNGRQVWSENVTLPDSGGGGGDPPMADIDNYKAMLDRLGIVWTEEDEMIQSPSGNKIVQSSDSPGDNSITVVFNSAGDAVNLDAE